jgi:vitellogenic carboxypeptidase-like protein
VLLWLQGGPGGSSLFGLFNEHGPFIVKKDLATLLIRPTTWALTHNVLYIDNPVGTGTKTEEHVIEIQVKLTMEKPEY